MEMLSSEPGPSGSIADEPVPAHYPLPIIPTRPPAVRKDTIAPAEINAAANTKPKPRKLVVCIDGTSNQFSDKNTNVIELYSHIKKDASQLTYYNSGIGTYAQPSWRSYTYMKQVFDNVVDLAIAWNLEKVIIGAYRWLSDNYQPDDQIFLFGFSRGAYQVRALAGMIHNIGLLHPGNQEQIPFAWELYAKCDPARNDSYQTKIDTFKKAFSRKQVDVRFLGAWDTVSSVGIVRGKLLPSIQTCKHVKQFRHALALDERRVKFLPEHVRTTSDDPNHVKEVWFAGTHSDIGGGNKENPQLDRGAEPLMWMMEEARRAGLDLEAYNVQVDIQGAEVTESLEGIWWALEVLPISRMSYRTSGDDVIKKKPHRGRGRVVLTGHKIHYTVLANYQRDTIGKGKATRKYEPKARFVRTNGMKTPWKDIFEKGDGNVLNEDLWEGNKDVLETLRQIKPLDAKPENNKWVADLQKYTMEPAKADLIWTYGGLSFTQKLANYDQVEYVQLKQIVKCIVGLRPDTKLQTQVAKQLASTQTAIDNAGTKVVDNTAESDRIRTIVIPRVDNLMSLWSQRQPTCDEGPQKWGLIKGFLKRLKPKGQELDAATSGPSTSEPQDTSTGEPLNKLARMIVEMLLDIRTLNNDYLRDIYYGSQVFEGIPAMFPRPGDEDSLQLTQEIVGAVAELAKSHWARGPLIANGVILKLIALLKLPFLKQQKGDLKLGVLRAMKSMAESESAAIEIVSREGVPEIIGLIKDGREPLAKEAIRVVTVLAKHGLSRATLANKNVAAELALLLKSTKRSVLEEALIGIAVIGQYDQDFFSANVQDIAQPLVYLAKTYPVAYKAIATLIDNDAFRGQYDTGNLIEQMELEMEKEESKSLQDMMGLVLKLAQDENSRKVLAQHNIASRLVPALKSKTPAVTQEASTTIEQLTRYPDLISQDLTQRLVSLAEDKQNPRTALAIVRVIAKKSKYYQTAQELVPDLFELMKTDEDESFNGEIAAEARDLSLDVIALSCQSGENTPTELIKSLAKILKLACIRGPYYWGTWDSDRMIEVTCRAFDVVKLLSAQPKPRRELIAEGIFETVVELLDSPVTLRVDIAARSLVDELKSNVEIYAEIRKYLPQSDDASSEPEELEGSGMVPESEASASEPETIEAGRTDNEAITHAESPEGSIQSPTV